MGLFKWQRLDQELLDTCDPRRELIEPPRLAPEMRIFLSRWCFEGRLPGVRYRPLRTRFSGVTA